jgi:hypothetical protein
MLATSFQYLRDVYLIGGRCIWTTEDIVILELHLKQRSGRPFYWKRHLASHQDALEDL